MTDQWRYVCPECGSSSLYGRQDGSWRCKICDEKFARRYDKKHEQFV